MRISRVIIGIAILLSCFASSGVMAARPFLPPGPVHDPDYLHDLSVICFFFDFDDELNSWGAGDLDSGENPAFRDFLDLTPNPDRNSVES